MTREEKERFGLPVKKQLVYYSPGTFENPQKVVDVTIEEEYDEWATLSITTETGKTILIHSGFLSQMQSTQYEKEQGALRKRTETSEWYDW